MEMRLAPAALGGFVLAIALILVFIYISPQQANVPGFYSGDSTATITSTTTATATLTSTTTATTTTTTTPPQPPPLNSTAISTSSTTSVVRNSTLTTTATVTASTTTSATTTATKTVTTTTAATTVTSTPPAQTTTTLTSAVTAAGGLPTEIAYTTTGIAVIAIIIAALVVTRRNLASANQLAAATTATTTAAGTLAQPSPAVKIGYEVDPEFMGEVKEEGKTVGYWISIPRETSRDIKVTLKPIGASTQLTVPRLISPPRGVSGTFSPPSLTLQEPQSETVVLTLEVSSDAQPGVYILPITAGTSIEKLYLIVE